MTRTIVLRRQIITGPGGEAIGEVRVEVTNDLINELLQVADVDIGNKPIDQCSKSPVNIPPDRAGKRAKLKKMGYTDADLDVLEKEGVI
ncbi:hypothetical protein [Candidatus Methanodesulfokora washburnensis]|uniref:Uncharacterized protein n=1 Tax=Candidatus Methanodesulfokora washburnensis TaxID=2478471 RepID=A0A3R9Q122_9CREN|nr:hypothetical protein [Candidatus Methanodesulfokores washburnensis]RSN78419.1 hypothetical protein D6D85_00930 [Candidatus Methanodesulfokores washburnensis]